MSYDGISCTGKTINVVSNRGYLAVSFAKVMTTSLTLLNLPLGVASQLAASYVGPYFAKKTTFARSLSQS